MIAKIAGCGLVTSLGRSVGQTWDALLAGRSIKTHTRLDQMPHPQLPRVTSLAVEAATEAIDDAGWGHRERLDDLALLVGTSKGPVEEWLATTRSPALKSDNPDTPAGRLNFGLATMSDGIAHRLGLTHGPCLTLSAACASGLHALIRGCMMIQSGQARRVLVVAAEASMHPLFLASFDRLGVLPPAGVPGRPFDINRQGFLMSDAAAAVCLDSSDSPGVYVDRFALGGDATHLTGSKSEGKVLATLLAKVMPERVDMIHAHGTGTTLNDAIELNVLESVLGELNRPVLYSHKGAVGHTLGASGLVSVVINCLCHRTGTIPGNVNSTAPMEHQRVVISSNPHRRGVHSSIVIASGFGGPTATVCLKQHQ